MILYAISKIMESNVPNKFSQVLQKENKAKKHAYPDHLIQIKCSVKDIVIRWYFLIKVFPGVIPVVMK